MMTTMGTKSGDDHDDARAMDGIYDGPIGVLVDYSVLITIAIQIYSLATVRHK